MQIGVMETSKLFSQYPKIKPILDEVEKQMGAYFGETIKVDYSFDLDYCGIEQLNIFISSELDAIEAWNALDKFEDDVLLGVYEQLREYPFEFMWNLR